MQTFPVMVADDSSSRAFEIDNAYISIRQTAAILSNIEGVREVVCAKSLRFGREVHINFLFNEHACVVWEPYGDNSRYWIGPENTDRTAQSIGLIEDAFKKHQSSIWRQFYGNIATLNFLTRIFKKDS
jgi:hypothetical protein